MGVCIAPTHGLEALDSSRLPSVPLHWQGSRRLSFISMVSRIADDGTSWTILTIETIIGGDEDHWFIQDERAFDDRSARE